ncbi:MAG: protease related protein, partial [Acidilobus sp.]
VSGSYQTAWSAAGFVPFFFNFGGSTGGYSAVEPMPWWQQGVVARPPEGYPYGRANPDVSANANVFPGIIQVTFDNMTIIDGGTSEASPLTAGLLALVEQAYGGRLGLVGQLLYALYRTMGARAPFIPVTFGYNIPWFASEGYNLVTGLGAINAGELASDLLNGFLVRALEARMPSLLVSVYVTSPTMTLPMVTVPGQLVTVTANVTFLNGTAVRSGKFYVELETVDGFMYTAPMTFNPSQGLWEVNIIMPSNVSGVTYIIVNGTSSGRWGIGLVEGFNGYFVSVAVYGCCYYSDFPGAPLDTALGINVELQAFELNGTPAPSTASYNVTFKYYDYINNTYLTLPVNFTASGTSYTDTLSFSSPPGDLLIEVNPPGYGFLPVVSGDNMQDFIIVGEDLAMPGVVEPGQPIWIEGLPIPILQSWGLISASTGQWLFTTIMTGSNVTAYLESLNGTVVAEAPIYFN